MHKFIILGGGISGLSNAYNLFKRFPQCTITLIEQSNRLGGMIKSHNVGGFNCEEGPRSIRVSKYVRPLLKMIDDIGIYPEIVPSVKLGYSYIYHNQKLCALPQSINIATLQRFYQDNQQDIPKLIKGWLNMVLSSKHLSQDISLMDYLSLSFDQEIVIKYIQTVFYGVYGCNIDQLSTDLCWNKLHLNSYDKKQLTKELVFSKDFQLYYDNYLSKASSFRFIYGLHSLPNGIHKYLRNQSDNYQLLLNTQAIHIDHQNKQITTQDNTGNNRTLNYNCLFVNLPHSQCSNLLNSSIQSESINTALNSVKTASICSKNYCFDNDVIPKNFNGFGYLINPNQNQKILGAVMDSLIFPSMYPKGTSNITVMTRENIDDTIIINELQQQLGTTIGDPKHAVTSVWNDCFVVYGVGHKVRMDRLQGDLDSLSNGSIKLGGNVVYSPAIPELVYQSYDCVKNIRLSQ